MVQRSGEAGRCSWHSFDNFICHVGLMSSYFTNTLGNGITKSKNMNVDTGEIRKQNVFLVERKSLL